MDDERHVDDARRDVNGRKTRADSLSLSPRRCPPDAAIVLLPLRAVDSMKILDKKANKGIFVLTSEKGDSNYKILTSSFGLLKNKTSNPAAGWSRP